MKRNRILVVSLLAILLTFSVLISSWVFSRLSLINAYAQQFEFVQNGTSLNLTMYGDPGSARQAFELFQYFSLKNLQWTGALPKPYPPQPGPPPPEGTIDLSLASAEFEKNGEDHWNLTAKMLSFKLAAEDLVNVLVQARNVEADIKFWTLDTLPALNITAVLTGNVNVSLSVGFLPLQNLMQATYSSNSERFVISVCVIKPVEIRIVDLYENDVVRGHQLIQAEVKTAPGISVNSAWWWVDQKVDKGMGAHFEGQMNFNEATNRWDGMWRTFDGGNGWYSVGVKVEGVQQGGFSHWAQAGIGVLVDNSMVQTLYVHPDGWEEPLNGIPIQFEADGKTWSQPTWFSLSNEWIGVTLTPPYNLMDGKIQFKSWMIRDETGATIFESGDPRLTITVEMRDMLFDGAGGARQLRCIYMETPPP